MAARRWSRALQGAIPCRGRCLGGMLDTMATRPEKIGRYEILSTLGQGAMGVVYKARDPLIGRTVAIKMVALTVALPPDHQEEFKKRFFREAQAAGNLHHPNVVTIYDLGEEGGVPFMAQEFVEGESLAQRLKKQGPMPLAEAVGIARQVADGLAYAHERGVIHRDIKPDNILIDLKGRAVITDFGVARLSTSDLTRTGEVLGTPTYMSPEQVLGQELDGRSDLFSLGVVLYTMLSGQKPFKGETISTVCYHVVHSPPQPPVADLAFPPDVAAVLERLLAKQKDERFSSAEELSAALGETMDRTMGLSGTAMRSGVLRAPTQGLTVPASGHGTAGSPGFTAAADTPPETNATSLPTMRAGRAIEAAPPGTPKRGKGALVAAIAVGLVLAVLGLVVVGGVLKKIIQRRAEPPAQEAQAQPGAAAPQPQGTAPAPVPTPPQAAPGAGPGGPSPAAKPERDRSVASEKPAAKVRAPAVPAAPPPVPAAPTAARLGIIAEGPLLMGQFQMSADGKEVLKRPFSGGSGPRGKGFLIIDHRTLPPGQHVVRFALAAAKPSPFYAEETRTMNLAAGEETIVNVRALRFPTRLKVDVVPREKLPPEVAAYFGPDAIAPPEEVATPTEMAAAATGPQADGGALKGEVAHVQILSDGPMRTGDFSVFVEGELKGRQAFEDAVNAKGKPGYHVEQEVNVTPGQYHLRFVINASVPRPYRAEGEHLLTIDKGQHVRLRVEPLRDPPRLGIREVERTEAK